MACSVPVISTKTGGIPEVVINGESGFLSKVGDIREMSRNAIEILSNDNKLSIFKNNALMQAMKFDVKQILPKYEKIYQKCIDNYLSK